MTQWKVILGKSDPSEKVTQQKSTPVKKVTLEKVTPVKSDPRLSDWEKMMPGKKLP